MTKLLVCVDGSGYADNICQNAAWAAHRLNASIEVLHVLRRPSDYDAPGDDHTGSIGLGARSQLLEALSKVDEERSRLDQEKGKIILDHAAEVLKSAGVDHVNTLHRRGGLVDTITALEKEAEIVFIGKRGEHANTESEFLGSNLEKAIRSIHKPVFVTSSVLRPINRFMIAYDGKSNADKAIDYICHSPLLKGLECHLLSVEHNPGEIDMAGAVHKLKAAGFEPVVQLSHNHHADEAISNYVKNHEIDLLVTGAYSHSRIRSIFLGSTTASLIKACKIPLLLFRD